MTLPFKTTPCFSFLGGSATFFISWLRIQDTDQTGREKEMEEKVYIAVTGIHHYFGPQVFQLNQIVVLTKEPDNPHDAEAIRADILPIGKVGYVANSPYTVPRGCRSAGRIYDMFEQSIAGVVRFILKETVIEIFA